MNQLLQGEPMSIFGDGTQMRAFTHIDDVAPIIAGSVDCAAARNQIFNVGADMPYTVNDLSTIVAEGLHVPCKVVHLDPRNEVKIAFSDHSKAERAFGKRQKKDLRDGVRAMAEWVRNHGTRESSVFEAIEIAKNMPPSWSRITKVSV
jgi:UDP-glucose 4-epimerase